MLSVSVFHFLCFQLLQLRKFRLLAVSEPECNRLSANSILLMKCFNGVYANHNTGCIYRLHHLLVVQLDQVQQVHQEVRENPTGGKYTRHNAWHCGGEPEHVYVQTVCCMLL